MEIEIYKNKLKELELGFERQKLILMREFVDSNNPFHIGDKITDHIGSIIIEKIGYSYGYSNEHPYAIYTGLVLKKDGTPTKKLKKRTVYQLNIL